MFDQLVNHIMYNPEEFEKAFAEIFDPRPEICRPESNNDEPVDCDKAHQATIDMCRGIK